MLGALVCYVHEADPRHFQPMNANFGLLPPLDKPIRNKRLKKTAMAERAIASMKEFVGEFCGAG